MTNSTLTCIDSFNESTKNGKIKFTGTGKCLGCLFRFSVVEQQQSFYTYRGRVSLLGQNGRVLHLSPSERKEKANEIKNRQETKSQVSAGPNDTSLNSHRKSRDLSNKNAEAYAVTRQIYLHSASKEEIISTILSAAQHLYTDNFDAICADLGKTNIDHISVYFAVNTYVDKFNNTGRSLAESTKKRHKNQLLCLSGYIGNFRMDSVPQKELVKTHKKLSNQADIIFRLARRFWDFCADRKLYHGENPFTAFYNTHKSSARKDPYVISQQALAPASLPQDVEIKIRNVISSASPSDGKATGLLLIYGAGLTAHEACSITWGQLRFSIINGTTTAQLLIRKDDAAGATHDYMRPCSPFCSYELYRRFLSLFPSNAPPKKTLLLCTKNSSVNNKTLTAYCRTQLLRAGMNYSSLTRDDSQPYGVGVRLLLKNYRYSIEYRSGFAADSGVVNFLCGNSLRGSVTDDHYRNFTDLEAQAYLQSVLARDKRFDAPNVDPIRFESCDDLTRFTAISKDPCRFTVVDCEIILKAGETFMLSSSALLTGNFKTTKPKSFSPKADTLDLES